MVIEEQVSDIHFKLTLLDRPSLISQYSKEDNPFIDFPGKLPPRYFFVFETEISTEVSTVDFSQKNITMQIESDMYKCSNTFTLKKAWEPYYENDSQELHMGRTINRTLKPADFTVSPDKPYKGTLVFLVPIKEAQEATIMIPARTPEGDEGIIEIPFTLKKMVDGKEEVPSENTGIFAQ
ncbi:MAG: hypothetical protein B6241_13450 [Spirochaetaceae bacterium 4572_59]|nr:MAG: hypothetical protein B6241_13450 [Spirochaetaceae bacterium 4572_59]